MSPPLPTASHARLAMTIEDLYRVFSAETPSAIEGCPCCINTRNVDVLLATPLRELRGDQLWRYISGAYLTLGGDRDFRYLMPRIFELAALSSSEIPDTEIVLSKLARAQWDNWLEDERDAVRRFIDAWFAVASEQDLLHVRDGWIGNRTESLLCGLAYARLPIAQWLNRLTEPTTAPLLDDLLQRHPQNLSAFWRDVPDGFAQLSAFLAERPA